MKIVDVGTGPPLVLVPGIQGRWEWMKPAVDVLAERCRVITFSLADERTSGCAFDPARGFDCYVDQIRNAMDQAGVASAAICGVSYGGLVAGAFAARHPDRTSALILVSAIPPSWKPDSRVRFYMRAPRLLSPLFCVGSLRLYREIAAATPGVLHGTWAALRHGLTAIAHPFSPTVMARRAQLLEGLDLGRELNAVRTPVLVVTGEPNLERVVPVQLTREYLAMWPHAQAAMIEATGHLGSITKPLAFANLVAPFVTMHDRGAGPAVVVGPALQGRPRGGVETRPVQPGARRRIG
jgi:pimeloyl-ACP methyl ester carboxylesterase